MHSENPNKVAASEAMRTDDIDVPVDTEPSLEEALTSLGERIGDLYESLPEEYEAAKQEYHDRYPDCPDVIDAVFGALPMRDRQRRLYKMADKGPVIAWQQVGYGGKKRQVERARKQQLRHKDLLEEVAAYAADLRATVLRHQEEPEILTGMWSIYSDQEAGDGVLARVRAGVLGEVSVITALQRCGIEYRPADAGENYRGIDLFVNDESLQVKAGMYQRLMFIDKTTPQEQVAALAVTRAGRLRLLDAWRDAARLLIVPSSEFNPVTGVPSSRMIRLVDRHFGSRGR